MPISKNGSEIFEQKPWLNDDPQTVDTLKENLGGGSGSGLPEITAEDDGKVLTANVSGDTKTATWETPSGGGGSYFVTVGNTPAISQNTVLFDDGSYTVTENWFTSQFDVQGVGNLSVTIDGTTIPFNAIAKNTTVPFNSNYEIGIYANVADEETWVFAVFPLNDPPAESIVVSVTAGSKLVVDETFAAAARMAIN